jgi:hypothetical protein
MIIRDEEKINFLMKLFEIRRIELKKKKQERREREDDAFYDHKWKSASFNDSRCIFYCSPSSSSNKTANEFASLCYVWETIGERATRIN